MDPELVRLLVTRYPLIFPAGDLPPRSGVGNGWFALVDALCERLQWWSDNNRGPQLVMQQIKEKYAELRIHVSPLYDPAEPCDPPRAEQQGMIWMTGALSRRTCELCGASGRWIGGVGPHTRCAAHERRRVQEPVPLLLYAPPDPIDERGTEIGNLEGVLLLADHARWRLTAPTLAALAAEAREIGRESAQLVRVRHADLPTEGPA
jgi:hypothetical protein